MKEIMKITPTERVKMLRKYYLENSPMSVNRELYSWHCHRSLLLYQEGYEAAAYDADTLRIRRSMAENFGTFAKKNANILIYNEIKNGNSPTKIRGRKQITMLPIPPWISPIV